MNNYIVIAVFEFGTPEKGYFDDTIVAVISYLRFLSRQAGQETADFDAVISEWRACVSCVKRPRGRGGKSRVLTKQGHAPLRPARPLSRAGGVYWLPRQQACAAA